VFSNVKNPTRCSEKNPGPSASAEPYQRSSGARRVRYYAQASPVRSRSKFRIFAPVRFGLLVIGGASPVRVPNAGLNGGPMDRR
jgi:hypothetical protein